MRARSLKPGFFKNEELGVADPINAIIFEGLWCLADRVGLLEDRPLRIHAEVNPYRDPERTLGALNWLAEKGFIHRYEMEGRRYIYIIHFAEHQNPHQRESPSELPPPPGFNTAKAQPRLDLDEPETSLRTAKAMNGHSQDALTPSSLTPDSPSPPVAPKAQQRRRGKSKSPDPPEWFAEFRSVYPERLGDQDWSGAIKASTARQREGHTPADFVAGAKRYAAHIAALGKTHTQYVKSAVTFLGPGKHFLKPWSLPPGPKDPYAGSI